MRQSMYCMECGHDFSVDMDMKADGNHVFNCPYCKHEHCRIVKNGEITDERWDVRPGRATITYYDTTITAGTYTGASTFLQDAWNSTGTVTMY